MCEYDDRAEADSSELDGFIAASEGNYEEAIRLYTRALDYSRLGNMSPEAQARILRCRGDAWLKSGYCELAIADYDEAIALNPRKAEGYRRRAEARAKCGDDQGAEADIAQAESLELNR